jgi:hypothetical protein
VDRLARVLSGGFRRSGLFGLVGVVVGMVAIAVIAVSTESGDASPKATYALIFGVVALFMVPATIAALLRAMPNSSRWKKLVVDGGPDGIVVSRKGGTQSDWLCDLWLAERLADAP